MCVYCLEYEIKNSNTKILEQSLEQYAKKIATSRGVWKDISWASAMKLKPGAFKFVRNSVLDLGVTIPLVQGLYDELKKQFKDHGIDITWGERDKKILEDLAEKQSPEELKRTFFFIN